MKKLKKEINEKMFVELPEKLSKDNIMDELNNVEIQPIQNVKKKNKTVKILVPIVATLMLMIGATAFFANNNTESNLKEEIENTTIENQNYDKVLSTLKRIKKDGYYNMSLPENMIDANINGGMGAEKPGDSGQDLENMKDFGSTNVQEKDVDESNVILTDGEYIYAVNTGKTTFNIIKSENGKMEMYSTVPLKEKEDDIVSNVSMFLYKNRIAVIYEQYANTNENDENKTFVKIFDITDKKTPKSLKSYGQEGFEIGTRRVDSKIYLITQRNINLDGLDSGDSWIPKIYNNGIEKQIGADKISIVENAKSPNYTVISVIDMFSDDCKSKAILDDCNYIYSTKNNIYTITLPHIYLGENETIIHKYGVTANGISDLATCKILGTPHNQFSFSEKDGILRVVTTVFENEKPSLDEVDRNKIGMERAIDPNFKGNNVYVLDEKLQMISSLKDIAKDEEIKSARFMGNMLYLVTFRQTDPLFVIDLSEPKNPVVKGKIKLPGYSYYLHPMSETLLLGIGSDGTEENLNGNLKVSLFDVSNPLSPKEISKVRVLNDSNNDYSAFSMLAYEHKIFIGLPKNEFAIPVEILGSSKSLNCYIRYGVKDNEVYEIARYFNDDFVQIMGGTYIENTFYSMGLDKSGLNQIISSYDMSTNKTVSQIKF